MSDLKFNIDDVLDKEFTKQKINKKLEDLNTSNADCKCEEHEILDVLTDVNEVREDVHGNKIVLNDLDKKIDILLRTSRINLHSIMGEISELKQDIAETNGMLVTLHQKFDLLLKAAFESNKEEAKIIDNYVQENKEEENKDDEKKSDEE